VNWLGDSCGALMNDPAAQADNQNWHVPHSCVDITSGLSEAVARYAAVRRGPRSSPRYGFKRSMIVVGGN